MLEMMMKPSSEEIIEGGCNDSGVCFLGETDNLITYTALSTHFNVTEGNVNTTSEANKWLHFTLDGKELYVAKNAVRQAISYNHLYSKGLVYGTNDNGLRVPTFNYTGAAVNQWKTINLAGKLYKCRLLKGADPGLDPTLTAVTNGYDVLYTRQSEWSRLFYPIVTDDPYITSYTGPKLASYTKDNIGMSSTSIGVTNWCQETSLYSTANNPVYSYRICRGSGNSSRVLLGASDLLLNQMGWRPVLELR